MEVRCEHYFWTQARKNHGYGPSHYTSNRFGLYANYTDYAAGKLGAIPIQ